MIGDKPSGREEEGPPREGRLVTGFLFVETDAESGNLKAGENVVISAFVGRGVITRPPESRGAGILGVVCCEVVLTPVGGKAPDAITAYLGETARLASRLEWPLLPRSGRQASLVARRFCSTASAG
eukprot:IDg6801t1